MKILIVLLFSINLYSEAWLSNRFAQNCAGCHAPGRYNLKPSERRCTLTCQACHVNPNGGGMRSQYGKWNQKKWLRSFVNEFWKIGEKAPINLKKQDYYKKSQNGKIKKNTYKTRTGLTKITSPNEKNYDKYHDQLWNKTVSYSKFRKSIPKDDPYWTTRRQIIDAGIELRYFDIKNSGDDVSKDREHMSGPMSAEFSIHFKPVKKHFSIVGEARFLNDPRYSHYEDFVSRQAENKSFYLFLDDLPYNIFLMYGLYRPLFGHYTADHYALHQELSGFSQNTRYNAMTLGLAPNVPFFNFHLIRPHNNKDLNQEKGYAFNFGLRFVTLGGSIMFSYWDTLDEGNENLEKQMYSLDIGMRYKFFIMNINSMQIAEEFSRGSFDKGHVHTIETKFQVWRENYLQLNYTTANVSKNLKSGKSSEYSFGFKSFLLAGSEIELLFNTRKNQDNDDNVNTTNKSTQLQLHLFY